MQTSTTAATDGGGDDSSKFDVIFGPGGGSLKPMESTAGGDFNPFDDITNEIYTPFLHYSSIPPPPESFKEDTVVDLNDLTTSYNVINSAANIINSNSSLHNLTQQQQQQRHPFDIFDNTNNSLVAKNNGASRTKTMPSPSAIGPVVKSTSNNNNNNKLVMSNYYDGSGSESTSETVSSSIETNNNNNNNNHNNTNNPNNMIKLEHLNFDLLE